jgi:hypothetical protein
MYQLYANGKSMQVIADTFAISRQRAAQIIARYARDGLVTDDESRALHRAQLEGMMHEALGEFFSPQQPKFDVKGVMLRDDDGNPILDKKEKVDWGTFALKVSTEIRHMDAIDKPRRKQLPENEAMAQMKEWLANLPRAEVIDPGE